MNDPATPDICDLVLGGQSPVPQSALVLGGLEGLRLAFQSANTIDSRLEVVARALTYGDLGLRMIAEYGSPQCVATCIAFEGDAPYYLTGLFEIDHSHRWQLINNWHEGEFQEVHQRTRGKGRELGLPVYFRVGRGLRAFAGAMQRPEDARPVYDSARCGIYPIDEQGQRLEFRGRHWLKDVGLSIKQIRLLGEADRYTQNPYHKRLAPVGLWMVDRVKAMFPELDVERGDRLPKERKAVKEIKFQLKSVQSDLEVLDWSLREFHAPQVWEYRVRSIRRSVGQARESLKMIRELRNERPGSPESESRLDGTNP